MSQAPSAASYVRGTVVASDGHGPVPAASVLLSRVSGRQRTPAGKATTGPDGSFVIRVDDSAGADKTARAGKAGGRYELAVRRGGADVLVVAGRWRWFSGDNPGDLRLCVALKPGCDGDPACATHPPALAKLVGKGAAVVGRIRHNDGTPVAGVTVRARDFQIDGASDPLASATTDADGWYGIVLPPQDDGAPGRNPFVEAFEPGEDGRRLGGSSPQFGAQVPATIDVLIDDDARRSPSEWAKNDPALQAERGAVAIDDIGTSEMAFLSSRTGIPLASVRAWRDAHRLSSSLDVGSHGAEAMYGLLRAGQPADLGSLDLRGATRLGDTLSKSRKANVISQDASLIHEDIAAGLRQRRVACYSDPGNEQSLTSLFSGPGRLSEPQVADLVLTYTTVSESGADLWEAVGALSSFDEPAVEEAKRMVNLGALAFAHAPTANAISLGIGHGPASDAAKLTSDDWSDIVDNIVTLPLGLQGDTDADRRANYASSLQVNAETAFPGIAVGNSLRLDASLGLAHAFAVHTENADFDFERDDVLAKSGDAYRWAGSSAQRCEAAAFQRAYRIAPTSGRFDGAKALYNAGLRSAHAVMRRGPIRAAALMVDAGMSESDARLTVVRAKQASAKALAVYTQAHSNLTGVKLTGDASAWPSGGGVYSRFLPTEDVDTSSIASWDELFGSTDYCTCKDCRSITGPAAYLVDLLHWLDERSGWTDKLNGRRPDLGTLKLNCENTNRTLPYIDLALEILESAAAAEMGIDSITATSTDAEGDELLAAPQYVNDAVYDPEATTYASLGTAKYPLTLPFDRPLAEARAFLGHLGVPRIALMRAFQAPVSGPTDGAIWDEEIGLFSAAKAQITQAGDSNEYARWGVSGDSTWPDHLRAAEKFLDRGELAYPDLLDLLHSRYVNPRGEVATTISLTYTDACDLATYTLTTDGTDDDAAWNGTFGRLRQMIRLRRATGWTTLDLDKVLFALGLSALDGAAMANVSRIHALSRATGLTPVQVVSWFANVDAWEDRQTADAPVLSLYTTVFLAPSIFPTNDRTVDTTTAFQFVLGEDGQPNGHAAALDTYASEVQALVGIDADAYAALLAALTAGPLLSLANLSHFYRWALLSRVLGLRVADALALAALLDIDPFESAADAWEFLQRAREFAASGLTLDEARYVVAHDPDASARVAPTDLWFQDLLARLGDELTAHFQAAFTLTSDPGHVQLDAMLDAFGLAADADLADVIAGTLALEGGYAGVQTGKLALLKGHCDVSDFGTELVRSHDDGPFDPTDSADAAAIEARQLWAAQRLAQWQAAESIVVAHFADSLGVSAVALDAVRGPAATPEALRGLGPFLPLAPGYGYEDWVDLYLRPSFRDALLTVSNPEAVDSDFALELETARILQKFAAIVARLGLSDEETAFWVERGATGGDGWHLLDPFAIPGQVPGGGTIAPLFSGLKQLCDLFRLRGRIPGSEPTFAALLSDTDPWADFGTFESALAGRAGWTSTDLGGALELDPIDDEDHRPRALLLHQFLDAWAILRRVGGGADTVSGWRDAPTATTSAQVVLAARSRYATSAAWATAARPVRDELRKAQRDALVSYLCNRSSSDVGDADDLYGKLLIDSQMNPVMLTARIKQATCSVQLYVQRNMVGIETHVHFNEDDRADWEWMKSYRVWEAARKVFLYPENWIEPELRDDKSPFFKTLETELSQGDVTDERAEDAALAYLDRLNEVAKLEILAYYVQRETIETGDGDDPEETLNYVHVFARSRGQNPSYWYRRWDDQQTWGAWQPVECGVQGTHLVPVVYERRLHLFWFVFDTTGSDDPDADPQSWYSIRVAYSELRGGKWSPKNEAEASLSMEHVWVGSVDDAQRASWLGEGGFRFLSSEQDDGTLVLRGLAWSTSANCWAEIGEFQMDPCTRQIDVVEVDSNAETDSGYVFNDADETEEEYATRKWDELDAQGKKGAMGSDHGGWGDVEYADLSATEKATFQSYLAVNYSGVYSLGTEETGNPQPATVLSRVDSKFVAPGYQAYDTYVNSIMIYGGTWEADTYEPEPGSESQINLLHDISGATVVLPTQWEDFVSQAPFFVQTSKRAWVVVRNDTSTSTTTDVGEKTGKRVMGATAERANSGEATEVSTPLYRFSNFYHPYVCTFIEEARREGIESLLSPSEAGSAKALSRQQKHGDEDFFRSTYSPSNLNVDSTSYPYENIDFDLEGAYSLYNWELFFHLPFYVANRLTDNQRFEDALRWYTFIFDPLNKGSASSSWSTPPQRYWKVKPFLDPVSAPVTDWFAFTGVDDSAAADSFERQVEEWRDDPFNPHLLARLRPGTYQKSVVMRYLDNLIGWGDQLFTRDTIETINEATQLYVLARQILGDRPERLTKPEVVQDKDFNTLLAEGLDEFSETVISPTIWLEGLLRSGRWDPLSSSPVGSFKLRTGVRTPTVGTDVYFCIPPNPKLMAYWDTIDDRLFKIHNSLNIEGVFRTLALYEPPIDPALLVRASAMGVDLGTVLSDLSIPLPNHRFSTMIQRAQALNGSVKALGAALLSALEKRDAEALALLRAGHESALLNAIRQSKEKAIDEARENLSSARMNRRTVEARARYYKRLQSKGWLSLETKSAELQLLSTAFETASGQASMLGGFLGLIPDTEISVTCPGAVFGGSQIQRVFGGISGGLSSMASATRGASGYLSTAAGYTRRAQEWRNQEDLANREIGQIDRQIAAAEIRVEIAKHDLASHDTQVAQADEIRSWMESKYTNQELYNWMVTQVSATYYQAYQLAYQLAKKAQACYRHELGREEDTFLSSLYWDNTRKGLLAGEQLGYDLDRMDAAYLENDDREYELTKNISLELLDGLALVSLRTLGKCYFTVPEPLFDLDFPSHYFRRIQSVSVSIPTLGGPKNGVNGTLSLVGSGIRTSGDVPETYSQTLTSGDDADTSIDRIALSTGANDSGLFQADLRDPRYLPFERRGAVSTWSLELTGSDENSPRQFDWSTITDVVLGLRYTARDAGSPLADAVGAQTLGAVNLLTDGRSDSTSAGVGTGLQRVFSAKRHFADAWFLTKSATPSAHTPVAFSASISNAKFPYFAQVGTISATTSMRFYLVVASGASVSGTAVVQLGSDVASHVGLAARYGLPELTATMAGQEVTEVDLSLSLTGMELNAAGFASLDDLIIVIEYALS